MKKILIYTALIILLLLSILVNSILFLTLKGLYGEDIANKFQTLKTTDKIIEEEDKVETIKHRKNKTSNNNDAQSTILKEFYTNEELEFLNDTDYVNLSKINTDLIIEPYHLSNKAYTLIDGEYHEEIIQDYTSMVIRLGTAKKLIKANEILLKNGYKLKILDAYRSYEVQEKLNHHYDYLFKEKNLNESKSKYIAKPGFSNHQKGIAVDVTLVYKDSNIEVEMPSKYLELNKNATALNDNEYLKILQNAMTASGLSIYNGEWWHFNDKEMYGKVNNKNIHPDDIN